MNSNISVSGLAIAQVHGPDKFQFREQKVSAGLVELGAGALRVQWYGLRGIIQSPIGPALPGKYPRVACALKSDRCSQASGFNPGLCC